MNPSTFSKYGETLNYLMVAGLLNEGRKFIQTTTSNLQRKYEWVVNSNDPKHKKAYTIGIGVLTVGALSVGVIYVLPPIAAACQSVATIAIMCKLMHKELFGSSLPVDAPKPEEKKTDEKAERPAQTAAQQKARETAERRAVATGAKWEREFNQQTTAVEKDVKEFLSMEKAPVAKEKTRDEIQLDQYFEEALNDMEKPKENENCFFQEFQEFQEREKARKAMKVSEKTSDWLQEFNEYARQRPTSRVNTFSRPNPSEFQEFEQIWNSSTEQESHPLEALYQGAQTLSSTYSAVQNLRRGNDPLNSAMNLIEVGKGVYKGAQKVASYVQGLQSEGSLVTGVAAAGAAGTLAAFTPVAQEIAQEGTGWFGNAWGWAGQGALEVATFAASEGSTWAMEFEWFEAVKELV